MQEVLFHTLSLLKTKCPQLFIYPIPSATNVLPTPRLNRGIGLLLTPMPCAKKWVLRFAEQITVNVISMASENWATWDPCAAVFEVLASQFGEFSVGNTVSDTFFKKLQETYVQCCQCHGLPTQLGAFALLFLAIFSKRRALERFFFLPLKHVLKKFIVRVGRFFWAGWRESILATLQTSMSPHQMLPVIVDDGVWLYMRICPVSYHFTNVKEGYWLDVSCGEIQIGDVTEDFQTIALPRICLKVLQ